MQLQDQIARCKLPGGEKTCEGIITTPVTVGRGTMMSQAQSQGSDVEKKRMSTCVPTEEINSHWTKIAHFIWKQMSFYIQTKVLYILEIQYEHLCKQEVRGLQRPTQAHITGLW